MGLFIFFGFILWGWAEISAFIYISDEIGGLLTLLGVFVTTVVGLSLLKSQGSAVMTKIRTDLAQGRAPVGSIADSLTLAVGGILMLIPGYVTDAVGIVLFVPGVRAIAGAQILHHFVTNNRFKGFVHFNERRGYSSQHVDSFHSTNDVIEGDVTEHQPSEDRVDNR